MTMKQVDCSWWLIINAGFYDTSIRTGHNVSPDGIPLEFEDQFTARCSGLEHGNHGELRSF